MPFIEPDDFIILFDLPEHASAQGGHQIPLESMRRLREVGVKTVLQLLSWRQIEKELGHRDWSEIDGFVTKGRAAGMKTLLMTYDLALTCAPPEWYLRAECGRVYNKHETVSCLSIWNRDAQAYADAFVRETCERYSAPDVCCISGLQREGEWVLPPGARAFFDGSAVADFRRYAHAAYRGDLERFNLAACSEWSDWETVCPSPRFEPDTERWLRDSIVRWVVHQQRLFAPYHGEVWSMLQHTFDWDAGNFCSDDIYGSIRSQVDATHFNIQFVHFPHGAQLMDGKDCDSLSSHGWQRPASRWAPHQRI